MLYNIIALTANTDPAWATHAQKPMGMQAAISDEVRLGVFRIPVPHMTILQIIPTTS